MGSILDAYLAINNLTKNQGVRCVLSSVCQNPQNETIDVEATWECLNFDPTTDKNIMYEVRNALQTIFLLLAPAGEKDMGESDIYEYSQKNMRSTFLFENHTRLSKIIVASRIMEHRNLSSFKNKDGTNVKPEITDIPMHIVVLSSVVDEFQKNQLPKFHEQWNAFLEKNKNLEILK